MKNMRLQLLINSYVMCMDLDGNNLWEKLDDFDLCKVCFLDVRIRNRCSVGTGDPGQIFKIH